MITVDLDKDKKNIKIKNVIFSNALEGDMKGCINLTPYGAKKLQEALLTTLTIMEYKAFVDNFKGIEIEKED